MSKTCHTINQSPELVTQLVQNKTFIFTKIILFLHTVSGTKFKS